MILSGGPSLGIEGAYLIDFLVLFGVLIWFIRKKRLLEEFVTARRQRLVAEIEAAQKQRAEAEAKLADYQSRLDHLTEEIERIMEDARKAGEAERKRIMVEATRAAERMRQDAQRRLEQEARKIEHELRLQVVALAMDVGEQVAVQQLSDSVRRRFVDQYVSEIGAVYQGEQA